MTQFAGFSPAALGFFTDLAANNDRAWFTDNKPRYERVVLEPLRALLGAAIVGLAARDIPLGNDPAKAIFRIHRDVRFSKDKSPYKTHAGAVLARDGGKSPDGGIVYFHLAPEGCFMAAGFYVPEPARLSALREASFVEPLRFQAILDDLARHGLELSDEESLTRLPRGYEDATGENLVAWLKLKSYLVRRKLSEQEVFSADLPQKLIDFAGACMPLLRFGWQALATIDPSDLKRQK